jgi:ribosomal protein S17
MNLPKHLTVFFAGEGLSQTEANHQANMVKEIADIIKREFESTGVYTEKVVYAGEEVPLDNNQTITDLVEKAQMEGNLYALSAWLRSAVKAKEELLKIIRTAPDTFFLTEEEVYPTISIPRPMQHEVPLQKTWTEEDVIGEFTIAERAEYLRLEAQAAHLGKKIHTGGILDQIFTGLRNFVPFRFHGLRDGAGMKDFPVRRARLYEVEGFEAAFFQLQAEHRSVEARLNWYKARIQNLVAERNAQQIREGRAASDKLYGEYLQKRQEWEAHCEDIRAKEQDLLQVIAERRQNATSQVSAYKIVVPKELEPVLQKVQTFKR